MDYSYSENKLLEIIAGVFAVLLSSGLLAIICRKIRSWVENGRKKNIILKLDNIKAGRKILDEISHMPNVSAACMLNGHDSGGIPDVGKPFYVTMIDRFTSIESDYDGTDYDNFALDADYIDVLSKIMVYGSFEYKTEGAPNGILKTVATELGVVTCRFYYIGAFKDSIVFITVSSSDHAFTDSERVAIDVKADMLRSCFKNRY